MLENEVNDNRKPNITWKMKKKGRLCVGHCVECARTWGGIMRDGGGERVKAAKGRGKYLLLSDSVASEGASSSASLNKNERVVMYGRR